MSPAERKIYLRNQVGGGDDGGGGEEEEEDDEDDPRSGDARTISRL
jgi:hypothetical protein